MSSRRMMGRLGWHGQCACCCGNRGKESVRAQERVEVRREAIEAMAYRGGTGGRLHDVETAVAVQVALPETPARLVSTAR